MAPSPDMEHQSASLQIGQREAADTRTQLLLVGMVGKLTFG
jgi:hypothetical protein